MIFRIKHRWQDALLFTIFGALVTFFIGGWDSITIPLTSTELSFKRQLVFGIIGGIASLAIDGVLHELAPAMGRNFTIHFDRPLLVLIISAAHFLNGLFDQA